MTTDNLLTGSAPAIADSGTNAAPPTGEAPKGDTPPGDQGTPPKGEQGAGDQGTPPKEGEGAGEGGDAKQKDEPQGAPEKYEFQVPEGAELDGEILGEFEQFARDLNLPQDKAQAAVDLGVKMASKWAEGLVQQAVQQRTAWAEEVRADQELGGDKLAENLAVANAALDAVGGPELIALLNETGLCNNIHVVRAFYRVGKQVSPDQFVGGNKGEAKPDLATRLYGRTMGKK